MKLRIKQIPSILFLIGLCYTLSGVAVAGSNLQPEMETNIVNTENQYYSYQEMMADINELEERYPDSLRSRTIGKSAFGRNIRMMTIGNPNAELILMVDSATHAREYITTLLSMKQAEDLLQRAQYDDEIAALIERVQIVSIPMLNPDGVMLSQQGLDSVDDQSRHAQLVAWNGGSDDFTLWKANGRGVDLNRNQNIDWIPGTTSTFPSTANYPGPYALSEPESIAIYEVMRQLRPDMQLNYHSTGSIIFWYGEESGERLETVRQQANAIAELTGYTLMDPEVSKTMGSIKLWFNTALGNAGFTVEVGRTSAPVPISEFPRIWEENKEMLPTLMRMIIHERG